MAMQGNYTTIIGTPPLIAQATLSGIYMRLRQVVVVNKYETEYVPVPAVPATATSPEVAATSKEVIHRVVSVTGLLDIYASAADPKFGKRPLVEGREFTCPYQNTVGSPLPEVQLYTHLMSLPEFAGCVSA